MNPITKTAGDVATFIKRQFGDESGTQLTDADIWRWIDSAQIEIISMIQAVKAKSTTDVIAGQAEYDLSELSIHQIESIHYNGSRLPSKTFSEAEQSVSSSGEDVGYPQFWYQWANVVTFWPTPAESITEGLRVFYTKMPDTITQATDFLSVPDKHFESVLIWVMSKAYEMDEEFAQASDAVERFNGRLLEQNEEEYFAKHATYQTITFVED